MDEKPVIIIGGGLWGTLIAVRLCELHSRLPIKLYVEGARLGESLPISFHESDVDQEALEWLAPFVSRRWDGFDVAFSRYTRRNPDAILSIEPQKFHAAAWERLKTIVTFNRSITPEEAVKEGSFVIDTKQRGYFKSQGYKKSLGLVVKLLHPHQLKSPVSMDAMVEQKFGFRYLQTLPLSDDTLFIKDVRFSSDPLIYHEDFEPDLHRAIHQRRWVVGDILEREYDLRKLPKESGENFSEGRVIRLDGFVHDITGEALPDAVRLIDRMVKTSFRLGELQELIRQYSRERKTHKRNLRMLSQILTHKKGKHCDRYQFFQSLHSMPILLRQKFYKGDLEAKDVLRTLLNARFSLPSRDIFELNKKTERVAIV